MSANVMLLPENVRHSLILFRNELRKYGIQTQITSTVRSSAKQQKLYEMSRRGLLNYPVAPPGASLHETGRAVDMLVRPESQLPLAASVGRQFGFKWAGVRDKVHFSYVLPIGGLVSGFKRLFSRPKTPALRALRTKEAAFQSGKAQVRTFTSLPKHCR